MFTVPVLMNRYDEATVRNEWSKWLLLIGIRGEKFTSMVMASSHLPLTQRLKLSTPINQSGEGTIFEISDTWIIRH